MWRLPSRRHSLATPRLLLSLNVIAVQVSPNSKITNAGASLSVTGHLIPQVDISSSAFGGIASSAVISNSRRLNGPERVCVLRSCWQRTAVNFGAEAPLFDLFDARRLLLQVHSPSDYSLHMLVHFRYRIII